MGLHGLNLFIIIALNYVVLCVSRLTYAIITPWASS
jgi:hypothetical protein